MEISNAEIEALRASGGKDHEDAVTVNNQTAVALGYPGSFILDDGTCRDPTAAEIKAAREWCIMRRGAK